MRVQPLLLLCFLGGCSSVQPGAPVDAAPVDSVATDGFIQPDLARDDLPRADSDAKLPAICNRPSAPPPPGMPGTHEFPVKRQHNAHWGVVFPKTAMLSEYPLTKPGAHDGAYALDHKGPTAGVAGFALSRAGTAASAAQELEAVVKAMGAVGKVTRVLSGRLGKAIAAFPAMLEVELGITTASASNAASVRDLLVAAMLGRKPSELGIMPQPFTEIDTSFTVRLALIFRFKPKTDSAGKQVTDARGFFVDSGDSSKRQALMVGGVARASHALEIKRPTSAILDDLANGTSVWDEPGRLNNGCDESIIMTLPTADIIWVVDEAPSIKTNLSTVATIANNMFSRLLATGVDFRVGVAGVNDPKGAYGATFGKFCSSVSKDPKASAGVDRFLSPSEQTTFSGCMMNPPGYAQTGERPLQNARQAVAGHLPRAINDALKIRKDASLHVIVVTEHASAAVKSALPCSGGVCPGCPLTAAQQAKVDQAVAADLKYLSGLTDPQAAATLHLIGPTCLSAGGSVLTASGLSSMALALGGQIIDMCQPKMSAELNALARQISGAASRLTPSHTPISASLRVELKGKKLERSQSKGFDYRAGSVVLTNLAFNKGDQVVFSYHFWKDE